MNLYACPDDEKNLSEHQARELMCEIGKRCYESGYNDANGGNLSLRLGGDRVLCTPTMISKGYMQPSDLCVVDYEGTKISGEKSPSSEILIHLYILKRRPDVQAVIHGHPRNATAFAISGTSVPKCVMPEIEVLVGEVPIAEYGDVGTMALAETLDPYVDDYNVLLMANHGAVAVGTGLIDAFWKMQIVDAYCDTVLKAMTLGPLTQVSRENMEHIFKIKEAIGIKDRRLRDKVAAQCSVPAPVAGQSSSCSTSGGETSEDDLIRSIVEKVIKRLK